ncbi:uncharacterized protein LOC111884629 [Lactuca sativa]|uniref:Uncharacterized protein n=1 Tax=Lactuca sativa TaxID=4236 RepID=A0A9R1XKL4_LACSA|nr:uncharacterized protein LOC111884629 [Lactuca sativa]XP_023736699.1 uncharacterized protein LOC111884629 [Lactuca sativa]KAJ0216279.1 hypothetical protein LSAT_V11C300118160 [Lactuca sativa]
MKTKFFLCMRPPVIETEDGDYIKPPPTVGSSYSTVSSKTSGRRNRDLQQRKRVAAERYIHQLPVKSNSNPFSGDISEGKSESYVEIDPQKSQENTGPVSETNLSISFPAEKSASHKKLSINLNGKVNGGLQSNSGVYLMVSSLFFTMFLGKFLGILCTLILVCSVYPHRKDDRNNGQRSINMVANLPEKGSPEDDKKRVIMEGLLNRKSHNRESIKFFS